MTGMALLHWCIGAHFGPVAFCACRCLRVSLDWERYPEFFRIAACEIAFLLQYIGHFLRVAPAVVEVPIQPLLKLRVRYCD